MADQKKIRLGFVGVGYMGQNAHLKNYKTLEKQCEVVAIAEVRPELARKVAGKYDIPHIYADHTQMLAKEKLDAIVCIQPFTRHGTLLPEVLEARVPVITEKPLAGAIEQGEKILRKLKETGSWVMVAYHKRSDPATMYAKAEIDRLKQSGELGKMKYVRLLMPEGDWIAGGFSDVVETSEPYAQLQRDAAASDMDKPTNDAYISFVNYYIHQVNLMRHLLGEPYKVTYADPAGVLLAGQSHSGVTGSLEMSPYATTLDWQESALVCFERGWIRLELPAPLTHNRPGRVVVFGDSGKGATPTTIQPTLPWVHAMRQQAMNFLAAVRGEKPPMCDAVEALEDLKVAREYIRLWKGK
jgi:predicted dehydrogenase